MNFIHLPSFPFYFFYYFLFFVLDYLFSICLTERFPIDGFVVWLCDVSLLDMIDIVFVISFFLIVVVLTVICDMFLTDIVVVLIILVVFGYFFFTLQCRSPYPPSITP